MHFTQILPYEIFFSTMKLIQYTVPLLPLNSHKNKIEYTHMAFMPVISNGGQVYFSFGVAMRTRCPRWMFNDRLDDTGWVHIPTELCHPWEVPVNFRGDFATMLRVTGPSLGLVAAAVKVGIFMNVDRLKTLIAHFKIPLPTEGSGKKGGLIKQDYASAVVDHFHPGATSAEKRAMVSAICGRGCAHLGKISPHASDILQAVNGLDTADVPEYEKMAAVAMNEIDLQKARPNRQPRLGGLTYEPKKNITSLAMRQDLDSLCPPGTRSKIYRHPQLKRYQAFYIPKGQGDFVCQD